MRIPRTRCGLAVGLALAGINCDDPINAPGVGALRIVVNPAGQDIITNGLRAGVGIQRVLSLDSTGLNVLVQGLPEGEYTVRLDGLANSCQVAGTNPRVVTVVTDDTTLAEFTMVCARRVGGVRVTTATTGAEVDPDGYVAAVIDGPSQTIAVNGTAIIPNVREGHHGVTLTDVASNCVIAGPDTVPVGVAYDAITDAVFSIQCVVFGTLELTVTTTGVDLDSDGYVVMARSSSAGQSERRDITPNGLVTLSLRPATDYQVTLDGVSANCDISGPTPEAVAIGPGITTHVRFDVVCEAVKPLAIVRDNDIYVIQSDGTGATRLTNDAAGNAQPAWSPTDRIAFTTLRHEGDSEIYVMNQDGTNHVRLTTSTGNDNAPSWSPDGSKIVFHSVRSGSSDLWVMNADGSGLTQLTNTRAAEIEPAWSSTDKIAFISDRDHPHGEMYVMNSDGSNVVRLTNNDLPEGGPAWSPDGSMIAFTRRVDCYYACQDLLVINADGSNETRPASGTLYEYHSDPAWAPTGRAIAFTRQYCDYYTCWSPEVWIVDLPGTQLKQIVSNAAHPAWKP